MFYQRPAFLESHMTANLGIPPGSTRPVLATAGIKAATSLNECAYKDLYIYTQTVWGACSIRKTLMMPHLEWLMIINYISFGG